MFIKKKLVWKIYKAEKILVFIKKVEIINKFKDVILNKVKSFFEKYKALFVVLNKNDKIQKCILYLFLIMGLTKLII